jgi:hypothetical protein
VSTESIWIRIWVSGRQYDTVTKPWFPNKTECIDKLRDYYRLKEFCYIELCRHVASSAEMKGSTEDVSGLDYAMLTGTNISKDVSNTVT